MALIDEVVLLCQRLAPHGWKDLILEVTNNELDITAANLAESLIKPITNIDRGWPGFEDFNSEGDKGIEPGDVSASLLYHALASPGVFMAPADTGGMRRVIREFPTLEELDKLECYIYSATKRSLDEVRDHAANLLSLNPNSVELVVATFALEYRPSAETVHQRYADLCLSRTGVARVGTASSKYDGRLRGYFPFMDGDSQNTIRVLPCRYSSWLAITSKSKPNRFGPSRATTRDNRFDFVVPLHRLFNGQECLKGLNLTVELEGMHANQKIAKLHGRLEQLGIDTGFSEQDRSNAPFTEKSGIANFVKTYTSGGSLLEPAPQPLATRTSYKNEPLSFPSPNMNSTGVYDSFSPTLSFDEPQVPVRPYPEYAHTRFMVENGSTSYFGGQPNTIAVATAGGYRALNVSDGTADGYIKSNVTGLPNLRSVAAYSLISAPDFFPAVDQREVSEWWERIQSQEIIPTLPIWQQQLVREGYLDFWRAGPAPLSDQRHAPNINLENSGFSKDDKTVSCVVAPLQRIDLRKSQNTTIPTRRHATLPDAAAGIFAPGWDVSADRISGRRNETHLSAYGLGSPFPEDAKLCAALSTFWPAAAPDTTRSYFQVEFSFGTVCPLTDEENGALDVRNSWDGLRGPRIISEDKDKSIVRYPSYQQADYTLAALDGKFSIALTSMVTLHDYINRILATLRIYRRFEKKKGEKNQLRISSFSKINTNDRILIDAERESGTVLTSPIYKFEVFDKNDSQLKSSNANEEDYEVTKISTFLVGTDNFFLERERQGDGTSAQTEWIIRGEVPGFV